MIAVVAVIALLLAVAALVLAGLVRAELNDLRAQHDRDLVAVRDGLDELKAETRSALSGFRKYVAELDRPARHRVEQRPEKRPRGGANTPAYRKAKRAFEADAS